MSQILLSFYGDDFTGSTDAMESLALAGVPTVLFTHPPTPELLAQHPNIRAFGVAGTTRSMQPDAMRAALAPAFDSLARAAAPIVHYKVCSTFDSSPRVGCLEPVIDLGLSTFAVKFVPIVVGAPSLGRYCVFGTLFARSGPESEPFRLDRHPSMSRHPVTPMAEADLRLHLARQTSRSIGLVDIIAVMAPPQQGLSALHRAAESHEIVFIDLLHESQLAPVGRMLAPDVGQRRFIIGSSGVESALCAHWRETGAIGSAETFAPPRRLDSPIIAVCGSCSPVTASQIAWARQHDFKEVTIDVASPDPRRAIVAAAAALSSGRSVALHTAADRRIQPAGGEKLGTLLGEILYAILEQSRIPRVLIAGGDTSGQIAQALKIQSMQMVSELTRGSPLVKVVATGSPADGIEMTFKGGQIGPVDFFGKVRGDR